MKIKTTGSSSTKKLAEKILKSWSVCIRQNRIAHLMNHIHPFREEQINSVTIIKIIITNQVITDPAHHQDDHYQSQPCSRYTHTVSFPILWNLSMRSVHHCLYASSIDHSIHCRFYSVRCINSKHQLEFGNGTNSETHWTIR